MSAYNGQLHREIEYTVYARLTDLSILEKAPLKEEHEQWQLPLKEDADGKIRARLRLVNGRQWTMTTKVQRPGMTGWEEVDATITEDLFNHLKEAAVNGYKKTRYTFPVPNSERCWEIDVFMDKSGKPHHWVKIDIEIKDKNEELPMIDIDIGAEEFIIDNHPSLTKEHEAIIDDLWEHQWQRIDKPSIGAVNPPTKA